VVDRYAGLRTENSVRLQRLIRRHVHRAHEPFGAIRADGQEGETRRRKFFGEFVEVVAESGVAAEVDVSVRRFDQPTAPESAIAIPERVAGKMLGGGAVDAEVGGELAGVPPIEFVRAFVSEFSQAVGNAEGAENFGAMMSAQEAPGWGVEMIVVIVAEEDGVDWRQIFEAETRGAMAFRADPLEGAGAIRPDWVREEIFAAELNEDGGVADECHAEFTFGDALGRLWAGGLRDRFIPGAGLARSQPFHDIGEAARFGVVIVEAAVAEVRRWRVIQ
jgi:hypothetical protein